MAETGIDDLVLPFQVEGADVRGRFVRLGDTIDQVLTQHAYPEPVSQILGESLTLAALIGSGMKLRGRFTFQIRSDGPINLVVADYREDGSLRGYAGFQQGAFAGVALPDDLTPFSMLGQGYLAMTIDQGPNMEPYQGIVPLEGSSLASCAMGYFMRSEQVITSVRTSIARAFQRDDAGTAYTGWRAGGIMIQRLGKAGEDAKRVIETDEDAETWSRASILLDTVEDHELLDPTLSTERVLYRLFHEDGVRVANPANVTFGCTCDAKRVEIILRQHSPEELAEMVEDGRITATCQFCSRTYTFEPVDFGMGRA